MLSAAKVNSLERRFVDRSTNLLNIIKLNLNMKDYCNKLCANVGDSISYHVDSREDTKLNSEKFKNRFNIEEGIIFQITENLVFVKINDYTRNSFSMRDIHTGNIRNIKINKKEELFTWYSQD